MTLSLSGTAAGLCLLLLPLQSTLAGEPITLVKQQAAEYEIVISDTPNAATREAVEELNYWVQKITGAALPVKKASEWDGTRPYIAIGKSKLTQENGWERGVFAQEEARIFIEPGKIGLLGNDEAPYTSVTWKGTYYAVLEFIKKSLDARWIWPGESGEVFTPRQTLEVEAGSWTWKPHILLNRSLRNGYAHGSPLKKGVLSGANANLGLKATPDKLIEQYQGQAKWLNRERMNKSSNIRFGHAFSKWWEHYSESHPEWFSLPPEGITQRGGEGVKLNISSPAVQDKIFADWKADWEKSPSENKYLNITPNDSRGFDTRPETRAWDHSSLKAFSDKEIFNGSEPVLSDRYVHFWNLMARRVRTLDPEARLATYAYRNYRKPPLGDEPIENNIVIGYVGAEGFYPDEPFIRDEWKAWSAKGALLFWRPNVLNAGHGTPYLYSRQLSDDFRFFTKHSLLGTDFDSLVGNWAGQGLTYYVLAEQHSRPDASYEELSGEYFAAFGPASQSIREFHEFFEEQTKKGPDLLRKHDLVPTMTWGGWWRGHIRVVPLFLTPEVAAHGADLLAKAREATATAAPVYQERVAFIERGFVHARLMAKTFAKLGLENPQKKVSATNSREILQPLWDYRQGLIGDYAVDVLRLFTEEQRQLGIWAAFETKADKVKEQRFPITEGWTLQIDPNNRGLKAGWQQAAAAGNSWRKGEIGKPWRIAFENEKQNSSKVVWYRVKFEVPEAKDTGERILLLFGSIDSEAKIWLNGTLVEERGYPHNGNYDSWAEAFAVDITRGARLGPDNELVIRVESENRNGGITGPVTLNLRE